MSLAVIVVGYRIVRLPPVGTLDVGATYRLFYSAAGVLLGALITVAMIYGFLGFAKSKQRRESSGERTSRIGMRGMFGIMIGLMVLTILSNLRVVRLGELMRTMVYSLPLLSCFASTYLTDRYTFFDLFIKRGLSLLLTILVLTTYFSVILPALDRFDFAWAEPWAYALALLPVAFALPWLYRRVGAWVDRVWLGRRFTTMEAVKQFLSSMQRTTTERQLIDRAEQGIATIFRAPTRIDVTSTGYPADDFESQIDVPIQAGRAAWVCEPYRVSRRAHSLRGWGPWTTNEVCTRSPGASGADGTGAPSGAWYAVGDDSVDRREDWLYGRDLAAVGAPGRTRRWAAAWSDHG